MIQTIFASPSQVNGTLAIPSSKSQSLRALLFALLATGESYINNLLDSPDTHAMIAACRSFGGSITPIPPTSFPPTPPTSPSFSQSFNVRIRGISSTVTETDNIIDAGNSGLVLRFMTAIGALSPNPVVVTGDTSIRNNRPIAPLLSGLQQLGVRTETLRNNGYAPLVIKGPLRSGFARINGEDSQPVSALLIAAGLSGHFLELEVTSPGEKPWIDLTLDWLTRLDIPYTNHNYTHYTVSGRSQISPITYQVPADLSSCAFPIAAALITRSQLTLTNIDLTDHQGDKHLLDILRTMGANIQQFPDNQLFVQGDSPLRGIAIDINDCIDAIVILSVIACFAEGETRIYNGAVARQKECDRITAIAKELSRMGATIEERPDGLVIRQSKLHGATLFSHHDHRIAMALTVAAMAANGESTIRDTACIAKTYPTFVKDFTSIGAMLKV